MNVNTPRDDSCSALQPSNDDGTAPSLVRGSDDDNNTTAVAAPNNVVVVPVVVATRPQYNTKAIPTNVNNNNNNNNNNTNNISNDNSNVVVVLKSATAATHQNSAPNPVLPSYQSSAMDWQPPPSKILPPQPPQHVITTTNTADTTNAARDHNVVMNRTPPPPAAAPAQPASARMNVPGPPPVVTTSVAVGQHHAAAAAAAAQHLQWNHHQNKKQRPEGPRLARASPEVIEIEDDTDNQNQELLKYFTAAIQRQIASKKEASGRNKSYPESRTNNSSGTDRQHSSNGDTDTGRQNQTFQNSNNSTNRKQPVMNERKRRATEPVHQEPPKRHAAAAAQQRHSLPTSSASKQPQQYGHHGPQVASNHSSNNIPQVNVNDAMNMALDAAILSDTVVHGGTKAAAMMMSSNGRRVDTPMTYLVRQLLGQVEILGDEPAVVLAPPLVRDASNKIRLVISKLIDMVVVKSKRDSEVKLHEAEVRQKGFDEATQQRNYLALKHFSDEKCQQLAERDKLIDFLRTKLHAQEAEMENVALRQGGGGTKATNSPSEKSNATMRNLISRLDDGLTTIQRQQKEIQVLRGIVERDTNTLLKRRDMIPYIKELFGLIDATDVPNPYIVKDNEEFAARIPASDPDMNLRVEIEELQATLQSERQEHERILKAYMKAAVHALKMQSGDA